MAGSDSDRLYHDGFLTGNQMTYFTNNTDAAQRHQQIWWIFLWFIQFASYMLHSQELKKTKQHILSSDMIS